MNDTPLRRNPLFWVSWIISTAGCEYWFYTNDNLTGQNVFFWAPFMGLIILMAIAQSLVQIYVCWNLDKTANDLRDWLNYR